MLAQILENGPPYTLLHAPPLFWTRLLFPKCKSSYGPQFISLLFLPKIPSHSPPTRYSVPLPDLELHRAAAAPPQAGAPPERAGPAPPLNKGTLPSSLPPASAPKAWESLAGFTKPLGTGPARFRFGPVPNRPKFKF